MWIIPKPGMTVELTKDWTFALYDESRNVPMIEHITGTQYNYYHYGTGTYLQDVTLPAGTQLIVDRVYIRQNDGGYNSITFRCKTLVPKRSIRFWAKLDDCEKMNIKVI